MVTDMIALRDEALLLLDGRGAILETARDVSRIFAEAGISAAVIGGVGVVLHGHVRTTDDVDILVQSAESAAQLLTANGFVLDPERREFVRDGVPVHLVLPDQAGTGPGATIELDGITTVSLPVLINMKLRTGSRNLLRAQDLADVIGLIRGHGLTGEFARHLDPGLRPEFRKLARAIAKERNG